MKPVTPVESLSAISRPALRMRSRSGMCWKSASDVPMKVRVLSVNEYATKENASEMYEILPE